MRTYIGNQEVLSASELVELAVGFDWQPSGIDRDLFLGPLKPESTEELAARRDVARQVLAELLERARQGDEVAAEDAAYAKALTRTARFRRPAPEAGRSGTEAAA